MESPRGSSPSSGPKVHVAISVGNSPEHSPPDSPSLSRMNSNQSFGTFGGQMKRVESMSPKCLAKHRMSFVSALRESPTASPPPEVVMPGTGIVGEVAIAETELSNIRRIFSEFDVDKSGTIDVKELQLCLRAVGHYLTLDQVDELIEEVTENPEKKDLNFTDFVQVILFWRDTARFRLFEMAGSIHEQHIQAAMKAPMFLSDAMWRWAWDTVIFLFAVYCACATPLYYVAPIRDAITVPIYVVEAFVTVVYLLDIFCCSKTSYTTGGQILVSDPVIIFKGYASSWMVLDILVAVPWLALPYSSGQYVAWLRCLKIFKVMIAGLWIPSNRVQMDSNYVTFHYRFRPIMEGIGYFIAFVHTVGAVMLLIDNSLTYAAAIYYGLYIMSAVGSGDQPTTLDTDGKKWYTCIAMLSSMLMNGYVVGNIVTYFAISDVNGEKKVKLRETSAVCEFFGIPPALKNEILQFQDYVQQHKLQLVYYDLVKGLPSEMKTQLSIYIRMRLLGEHPLFKQAHQGVRVSIAQHLDEVVFCPEEFIALAGEDSSESFFMGYGFADVVSLSGYYFATMKQFDYFGEQALYRAGQKRVLSVKALTYCDTFSLTRELFQTILQRYPLFRKLVTQVEGERQEAAEIQSSFKSFEEFAYRSGWSKVPTPPKPEAELGHKFNRSQELNTSNSVLGNSTPPMPPTQLEMDDELRAILKAKVMADSLTAENVALVDCYFSPFTAVDPHFLHDQVRANSLNDDQEHRHMVNSGSGSYPGGILKADATAGSFKPPGPSRRVSMIDSNILITTTAAEVAISVYSDGESDRSHEYLKPLTRKNLMEKKKEIAASSDFLSPSFVAAGNEGGGMPRSRSHSIASNGFLSSTASSLPSHFSHNSFHSDLSKDGSATSRLRSLTPRSPAHTQEGGSRRQSLASRRESLASTRSDFVIPRIGSLRTLPRRRLTSEAIHQRVSRSGSGQDNQNLSAQNITLSTSASPTAFGCPLQIKGEGDFEPSSPTRDLPSAASFGSFGGGGSRGSLGGVNTFQIKSESDFGSRMNTGDGESSTGSGMQHMTPIRVVAPVLPAGSNPGAATYLQNLFFQTQDSEIQHDTAASSESGAYDPPDSIAPSTSHVSFQLQDLPSPVRSTKSHQQHHDLQSPEQLPKWALSYISKIEAEMEAMNAMLAEAHGEEAEEDFHSPLAVAVLESDTASLVLPPRMGPPSHAMSNSTEGAASEGSITE